MSGPLRLGSLCSGYGGLDLAVAQVLDVTHAWLCELDPHASRVLARRWPGVPNLGDLTAVDWADAPPVDVLCAGWPCQPISKAGRRKVTNDARWLWPHIAHAVRVLRPSCVVLENVDALLRPWRDDDGWWNPAPVEEVTADLAEAGFVGSWVCLAASDVGAPHRRERVFIVGVARNADDFGCEGRVAGALRDARRAHRRPAPHGDVELLPTPAARCGGGRGTPSPEAAARRMWDEGRRNLEDAVALLDHATPDRWGVYADAVHRWEHLTRPAPSPVDDRGRLAPEFSEWMMGLPAGWVTAVPGVPYTRQLHVIGNGVCPQQGAAGIADALDGALALLADPARALGGAA